MATWTCTICNVGWATENGVPDRCPVCSSRGFEEVVPAPVGRQLLVWGGLDFDTAEMDQELREALAAVAPEDGALRGLPVTASCARAVDAVAVDLATSDSPAANNLLHALQWLAVAQQALRDANLHLTLARRALGLVS